MGFVTVCGTPLDQARTERLYSTAARHVTFRGSYSLSGCRGNCRKRSFHVQAEYSAERNFPNSANVAVRILGTEFPEEIVTVTLIMILCRKVLEPMTTCPRCYGDEAFLYFAEHRPARTMEFIWFGSEKKPDRKPELCEIHENEMGKLYLI